MRKHLFVLDALPESFPTHVVPPCATSVHRELAEIRFHRVDEDPCGELATLIGVDKLWAAIVATRASCQHFVANRFRLLLAALAYTLMQAMKRLAFAGARWPAPVPQTIREQRMKIGASIVANTHRIRVALSSMHLMQNVYMLAARRVSALLAEPALSGSAHGALRGAPWHPKTLSPANCKKSGGGNGLVQNSSTESEGS